MRAARILGMYAVALWLLIGMPRAAWSQDEAPPAEEEIEKEEAPAEGPVSAEKKEKEEGEPGRTPALEAGKVDRAGKVGKVGKVGRYDEEAGAPAEAAEEMSGLDIEDLLKYLDDLYRADSSIAKMRLTVTTPRRTRTLRMKAWSKGTDKALIVIESPAREKGIATLKVGKNLWNYLPRISRTIRIPPSMMLGSWMGSDFTNDDLVKESSLLDDFDGEVVGRSEDPEGWLLKLEAKEGTVGLWKRIEYVVSLDGKLPLQAKHYDRKGRLSRVMEFTDVREFDGRRIPTRMVLTPVDKKGHRTEMVYEDIRFNVDVPESTFSLSRLERKR